ncbi:hypothetical protein [Burkholderia perseverans]|uniref:hypothetical protein n=1 Tax=Burkholderia perseverans TaxID=2615214 RepID=UPI001FEF21EF|nr:hypothetical protein [Burkholderia perseverans]
MTYDELMIVDPAGLDRHELSAALRNANAKLVEMCAAIQKYRKALDHREQVGRDLTAFVEGVLKACLRNDTAEVSRLANQYFSERPRYRERLEEDIEHAARQGKN